MATAVPENLPHLSNARFFYSADGEKSSDLQQVDIDHEASQWVIADLGRISRELAEVPHDETALNLTRIHGFFERYGLVGKSFVGVDADRQQDINEIMGFDRGPTQTVASHFPLLDFTYVLRGDYEAARGTAAIESEGVHDLFHAYKPEWSILMRQLCAGGRVIYSLRQNGFVLQTDDGGRGGYFEEAGAETMLHKYVTEELRLPNGFLNRTKPQEVKEQIEDDVVEYLLPGSYLYASTVDGNPKWHKSAHAAFGMQLLIAQDPHIFTAMIASRSDATSLHEFARRIDALNPGLYSALDKHPYDHKLFAKGTRHIIDMLYDGDSEKALTVALEQDFEGFNVAA